MHSCSSFKEVIQLLIEVLALELVFDETKGKRPKALSLNPKHEIYFVPGPFTLSSQNYSFRQFSIYN